MYKNCNTGKRYRTKTYVEDKENNRTLMNITAVTAKETQNFFPKLKAKDKGNVNVFILNVLSNINF